MSHPEQATSEPSGVNRRQLLRTGGAVISLGAIVAACGANRGGSTAPGRIGTAVPTTTLPPVTVDDLTVLRTAQSLEHTTLAVYTGLVKTGALTADEATVAGRIVADHTAHAAAFGELITGLGGTEFNCANPFLLDRAVEPILAAMKDSDDAHRDALNIAHAFESLMGASYQALILSLKPGDLRRDMIMIGGEEHRHATVLARTINPKQTFSPAFFGEPIEPDKNGFTAPYAIPSVFGRVSGIDLIVGKPSEEGTRFATQLQTPAANSFVYDYQSC